MVGTLRSRLTTATVAAACALTSALTAVTASPAAAAGDGLQRELDRLVGAEGGPPGVVVVLDRRGHRTVYRSGLAVVDPRRPSPDDHMRIASVAKAFSGAVALQLVDRGRLHLDDTVARRLPQLPAAWGAVTLRQLLQHTSGLPDYSASAPFIKLIQENPRRHFDSQRLLSFVAGEPLLFAPGSRFQYSNSDNIAVALMAEAVTGRRYEDLLKRLVYDRLGLRHTSLPSGYELPEPFMHGYVVPSTGAPEDVSTAIGASGAWASGGIVSTPNDLVTFIKGYAGPELISRSTREEQQNVVPGSSEPPGPGTNAAGLAIFRYTTRCGVVYGHTGNTLGYTQLALSTADGSRSMTFSVNETLTQKTNAPLFATMRGIQEDFVCALLR
ncbi:serine hydrolase domain-containing protein [Catenulispora subtropica]|uniref:Beta-lactamase-related domain-containing protein n=1 Tax=Catenulispora subtropica TaxID=450798 RepID=A0ABN2R7C7_9ACTN